MQFNIYFLWRGIILMKKEWIEPKIKDLSVRKTEFSFTSGTDRDMFSIFGYSAKDELDDTDYS